MNRTPLRPAAPRPRSGSAEPLRPVPASARHSPAKGTYLEAIHLAERLHRQFLEVVQAELNRAGIGDVNNVQALILFNIREDELTVGELTNRGYYLGSNVSYNLRKMAEHGYLVQERSPHDRRSVRVRLSDKGLALCRLLDAMFERQLDAVSGMQLGAELKSASNVFRLLERFWISQIGYSRAAPRD
ncbi:MAG TPA: MarR family transcriptional regulator [Candidatus Sulfotelmatobacter sp.]|nr:MarR family transcriptional regulator [Candidatus Sulfotelmatobacter sp.]